MSVPARNQDRATVEGFGLEWETYDQSELAPAELSQLFDAYFAIFPWSRLPANARGFDLGCGSGRWARLVAPRVGELHCVDASERALASARRNLAQQPNCVLHHADVGALPLAEDSMDFGYSLGVLHHVPDTAAGLAECVRRLRPGAPFLLYLYYALETRPRWYRAVWKMSDAVRRGICRLPGRPRLAVTTAIAATVYWPLARLAALVGKAGLDAEAVPLAYYRNRSFYTMRTDALDRFGTAVEQRFTRAEIEQMMRSAGLRDIVFSEQPPYWCAVGYRSSGP
jgi:SAM-dependent methyltransferase